MLKGGRRGRKGVIPCILEKMLAQRKIAKGAFAAETDPMKKMVLKAREMSCKLVCNGFYGALGCANAHIPLRPIAETTTGLGRKDIEEVKRLAEGYFTMENGYEENGEVVCGDTDSVFIRIPNKRGREPLTIAETMEEAKRFAELVNSRMKRPKSIEFEKVYENLLLMKKKRYIGNKYEKATDAPKVDIKGIECVRRDGSPLIRNLVLKLAEHLAKTANVEEGALMVRNKVREVMMVSVLSFGCCFAEGLMREAQNKVGLEEYAIQKVLRKSIQDCSQPMTSAELSEIRRQIESPYADGTHPLTENELDEALRAGVKIPWKIVQKLPHVSVAWKMRIKVCHPCPQRIHQD